MHFTVYLPVVAFLSLRSASALHPQKRFDTAPFKPTSCDATFLPSITGTCTISGLPTTGPITLTTPPAPTSWSTPPYSASWQVVLNSAIEITADPNDGIEVYDIDIDSSPSTFTSLQMANKYIICYFSAGSSEGFRSDVACFDRNLGAQDYGCNLGSDWGNEFWLNSSSLEVRKVMQHRIQQAKDRNCSAIDPDNIDAYDNDNGIGATEDDAIEYVKFLSREARSRGMGISLKNSPKIASRLTSYVDFAVNEQCIQYTECNSYTPFFASKLPVFNIEYPPSSSTAWIGPAATAKCNAWKAQGYPNLRTNLKNYPTVDCGVSRCEDSGLVPPVPLDGPLPIPAGCVNGN